MKQTLPFAFFVPFVLVALVGGCTSKEDTLRDLKRERRESFDALYASFGGSDFATALKDTTATSTRRGSPIGELAGFVSGFADEVDREGFEVQCLILGTGDRPPTLTDKARAFFADKKNTETCEDLWDLSQKIAALEKELGPQPLH